jgi:Rod binding domain-containing protein
MTTPLVDTNFALREATDQSDAIRRKLDMDALRERLGDQRTKDEKLRESCEGFEAIFVQKMWEQMRKTLPKEGYLHSKDEETYQSLFDIELSKKMTSAGGIGLADMLYEQLSQQLERTARSTTPGAYRRPLELNPADAAAIGPVQPDGPLADRKLTAKDLYSPLEDEEDEARKREQEEQDHLAKALEDFRVVLEESVSSSVTGSAIRSEIADRSYAGQIPAEAVTVLPLPGQPVMAAEKEAVPDLPGASAAGNPQEAPGKDPGFRNTTWQGNGIVSAAPKPISTFAGNDYNRQSGPEGVSAAEAPKQRSRSMLLEEAVWPHGGEVVSSFGWENDPSGSGRRWNSGVTLSGAAGDPVRAALEGTVIFSGPREGFGNTVVLEHQNGMRSSYGNVTAEGLKVGDTLQRGTEFARIETQAPSAQWKENFAPLHFELKRGEMALNPEAAIKRPTVANR